MSPDLFRTLVLAWLALAGLAFVALFFFAAPYGRHARAGWGPSVGARLGWVLMEIASPLVFLGFFLLGSARGVASYVFLGLWLAHYLHRAVLYPLSLPSTAKPMPLSVAGLGLCFNLVNAATNGYALFFLADTPASWLLDPRFLLGVALFAAGFALNRWSDAILRGLRKPGETGYKIPQGGPYRLVSSPNYLGEMIEWLGWALLTWSLAGLAFAAWTVANLAPRARTNHRWYRERFPDYPHERRALVPFVW